MTDFEPGTWNAICDRCGFRYKAHKLRKEWTGLRVCDGAGTNHCFDDRHPQERVRGKIDDQAPEWVRPRQDGAVLGANEVTPDDL
ncbi:hypothetical protein AB3Y40_06785 [Yoonia sp. R2331]|uniref:hypothetical protein n=1 Tax=Yoonia sp. R2331 TaxID=3237238 RepID=UPI0034E5DCB6